jgi:hypothetical protein
MYADEFVWRSHCSSLGHIFSTSDAECSHAFIAMAVFSSKASELPSISRVPFFSLQMQTQKAGAHVWSPPRFLACPEERCVERTREFRGFIYSFNRDQLRGDDCDALMRTITTMSNIKMT